MYRILVAVSVGWALACAGAPAPTPPPAPAAEPPVPPTRVAEPSCCRKPGIQGMVHEPLWDAAQCQEIGTWVQGRECEPACCCRNEVVEAPFVKSTADWCADVEERECLPLTDPSCG